MSKIQQNPFFMEFISNFFSAEDCKRKKKKEIALTEMLQESPPNRSQQLPVPYKRLIDEMKQN